MRGSISNEHTIQILPRQPWRALRMGSAHRADRGASLLLSPLGAPMLGASEHINLNSNDAMKLIHDNKINLSLLPVNGGPFNCLPAREVELAPERILTNNVILPWDFNSHDARLFVVGNEFGAVGAVWADHEQEALDELIDKGLGDSFLISEADQAEATEEEQEEWALLGNAGEPCNLDMAWVQVVRLDPAQDCLLLCLFAEARGNCADNLDF